MLPPIPQKLWQVDDSTVRDHSFLDGDDACFYIWEYAARKGFDFSPANNFVWNLKIKPTAIERSPLRLTHKLAAISHAGAAIRTFLSREFVESRATFVPMPCSKIAGDPDYDNRLAKVLGVAFQGWDAEVRELLKLTRSTVADHESAVRSGFDELSVITELVDGIRPRSTVVVLDDVLNTGKHFKVARRHIRERYPDVEVRGLFLARCIRD